VTIDWEPVEGATKYLVQIKDSGEKLLVDRTIADTRVSFPASPGTYRIRVGAFNIFEKLGSWSDWTGVKVVAKDSPEALPYLGMIDHGFTFSGGYQFSFIFSDFSDVYESSRQGWIAKIGYQMKQFDLFATMPVVRNMRLEADISNRIFTNRDSIRDYDISLNITSLMLAVAYVTDFDFPLNLALRIGGGAAFTSQQLKSKDPTVSINMPSQLTSTDPCYLFSASLVLETGINIFIETGAGAFLVDYLSSDLKSTFLFILAGMHI
jgi:hypothetical protein